MTPLLLDVWHAARAAWPTLDLDHDCFARHVHARGTPRYTDDLYLACACLHGVPGAREAFARTVLTQIDAYVARIDGSPGFADDVRQQLAEKLLTGAAPRIGEYSGSGALANWVRVAALRTALNLRRDRGLVLPDANDGLAEAATREDPELELVKRRYRGVFEAAVREAYAGLPADQRTALRMNLVDGVATARVAQVFQVNQSTIVRWLAAARTQVRNRTHELVHARLGVSAAEFKSLAELLLSRLEVSIPAGASRS